MKVLIFLKRLWTRFTTKFWVSKNSDFQVSKLLFFLVVAASAEIILRYSQHPDMKYLFITARRFHRWYVDRFNAINLLNNVCISGQTYFWALQVGSLSHLSFWINKWSLWHHLFTPSIEERLSHVGIHLNFLWCQLLQVSRLHCYLRCFHFQKPKWGLPSNVAT